MMSFLMVCLLHCPPHLTFPHLKPVSSKDEDNPEGSTQGLIILNMRARIVIVCITITFKLTLMFKLTLTRTSVSLGHVFPNVDLNQWEIHQFNPPLTHQPLLCQWSVWVLLLNYSCPAFRLSHPLSWWSIAISFMLTDWAIPSRRCLQVIHLKGLWAVLYEQTHLEIVVELSARRRNEIP